MTFHDQHQRATLLKEQLEVARKRLNQALQKMNYKAALEYQMEVDALEKEAGVKDFKYDYSSRPALED
jgi:hypothetical protein